MFQYHRATRSEHDVGVEDAAKVDAPCLESLEGGRDDLCVYLLLLPRVHERQGRKCSHAAGIEPLVVIEGAFVILRQRQGEIARSIADSGCSYLDALYIILDHYDIPRSPKYSLDHDLTNSFASRCHIKGDDRTFASRVAIGLDDDGYAVLIQVGKSFSSLCEGTMLRGGDIGLSHQFFRKSLTSFQRRSRHPWSKYGELTPVKDVGDARYQRHFWPDYCQINVAALREVRQFREMSHGYRNAFRVRSDARVSWRGVDAANAGTLRQFPGERVFPCS